MQSSELVAMLGFVATAIGMIVSVVWAVGRMKAQGEVIASRLMQQADAVNHLATAIEKLDGRLGSIGERVARLEAIVKAEKVA